MLQVTQKVNFAYDQHIYKDLIPLEVDHCKLNPVISSREPLPHKDKEPLLSDFLEIKRTPNYCCYPVLKTDIVSNTITNNNLKLYHILEN